MGLIREIARPPKGIVSTWFRGAFGSNSAAENSHLVSISFCQFVHSYGIFNRLTPILVSITSDRGGRTFARQGRKDRAEQYGQPVLDGSPPALGGNGVTVHINTAPGNLLSQHDLHSGDLEVLKTREASQIGSKRSLNSSWNVDCDSQF